MNQLTERNTIQNLVNADNFQNFGYPGEPCWNTEPEVIRSVLNALQEEQEGKGAKSAARSILRRRTGTPCISMLVLEDTILDYRRYESGFISWDMKQHYPEEYLVIDLSTKDDFYGREVTMFVQ